MRLNCALALILCAAPVLHWVPTASAQTALQDNMPRVKGEKEHLQVSGSVDTAPIVAAAISLLAKLDDSRRKSISFPIQSDQWRVWSNFHQSNARIGLRIGELGEENRAYVYDLLKAALSARGMKVAENIMQLNHVLGILVNNTKELNEEDYYLVFFGEPSMSKPWGFQFEGHHLVINYFVDKNQVVMSPTFWGSEPTRTPERMNLPAKYQGLRVLESEREQARFFIESLTPAQQKKATLGIGVGIKAGSGNDKVRIPRIGLAGTEMNGEQQRLLLEMIGAFVGNVHESQAKIDMAAIASKIDDIWFSSRIRGDGRIFYRVISSEIQIEFDEVPGVFSSEKHVHAVVRRPNGIDYGQSLLHRHLQEHRH